MIKIRYILPLLIFICSGKAVAQDYGDEWINYEQEYYKIQLAKDDLYTLTFDDLTAAGFPASSVVPSTIQLFRRGVEYAIHMEGDGDGSFDSSDYIVFYGEKNDGETEKRLYVPEAAQPHELYSIYSDTSAYFLTYRKDGGSGKRISFYKDAIGALPQQSSQLNERLLINNQYYAPGRGYYANNGTHFGYFDYGEGWTGRGMQENVSRSYTLSGIGNQLEADGLPTLQILLQGLDDLPHVAEIFVGPDDASLRSLGTKSFADYETVLYESQLQWSDVAANGSLRVKVMALGVAGGNDLLSVSYIKVIYPRNFNLNGIPGTMWLRNEASGQSFIKVVNAPANPIVFDISNPEQLIGVGFDQAGSTLDMVVNGTDAPRQLLVGSKSQYLKPVIQHVIFNEFDPGNFNYLIVYNNHLTNDAGVNPIQQYVDYRASTEGGGFAPLALEMNNLFDQYNYGEVSPLAIYDMVRKMKDQGNPEYLFLIGKGVDPYANQHRRPGGLTTVNIVGVNYEIRDLVMSSGNPGSDILFTAGIGENLYQPAFPVGRIPALQPADVSAYLDKVKTMEALPYDALWRKDVLHLSGGITAGELATFRNYMDGFATIAEGDYLGGQVKTISKTNSSAVQFINISEEVNNGLNLVTFFGHSSPNITDIDIGYASHEANGYNNTGKYPVILLNGCSGGQFFLPFVVFGEDWILAPNKGAVGFIGHSSFGYSTDLKKYTTNFYQTGYGDAAFIDKSLGLIQGKTIEDYMATSTETPRNITQVTEMVLLGDPYIRLFGAGKPDYALPDNSLSVETFNQQTLSSDLDSLQLNIHVKNFGITHKDSITVSVTRTLNDNVTTVTYDSVFPPVDYQDTLHFTIQNTGITSFGTNTLLVAVDALSKIDELNEANNTATLDLFIPKFGTKNLFPFNYGLISETSALLTVQANDLRSSDRVFLLEIDTTASFDSPYKKANALAGDVLTSWLFDFTSDGLPGDSITFFWRTKFQNTQPGEGNDWAQSSFSYIASGPNGWGQLDIDQVLENQLVDLDPNGTTGYDFEASQSVLAIRTFGDDYPYDIDDISIQINATEYNILNVDRCEKSSFNIITFDQNSAAPYAALPEAQYPNQTCGRFPQVINSWQQSGIDNGNGDIFDFIDAVKVGDSVAGFTIGGLVYSTLSGPLLDKLGEIGIAPSQISGLSDGEAFIFYGKKGISPGEAIVISTTQAPPSAQSLESEKNFTGYQISGTINSALIGPATQWGAISYRVANASSDDEVLLSLFGISLSGEESLLLTNATADLIDLSFIDPVQYPLVRLSITVKDEVSLTAPIIDDLIVTYEPAPEGILIVPEVDMKNIPEGLAYDVIYGFYNISDQPFPDSLIVHQRILNKASNSDQFKSFNIKAPLPGDTTLFELAMNTRGLAGENDVSLFVNPRITAEQYYENNRFSLVKTVRADEIDPLLDVAFDGQYIMNGDIVSSNPLISINIRDENPYLLKKDTTGLQLYLKQPCESCVFEQVAFSSSTVKWRPATENTSFAIEYTPGPLNDGVYSLRIMAEDESGNKTGDQPYEISFEVVNESTITNFYPYPNPFSTSTRFIFTLTGSELPDQIKIQIMTVSGKMVREIGYQELGPIHIGNNISQYAWDGKDQYGDQLANGVYLYKVTVLKNGEIIEQRATAGDKAFTKGFGKLYLLK